MTTVPLPLDSFRPMKMGNFKEDRVVIHWRWGLRRAATQIDQLTENEKSGGSAMPLSGIVLPPSKNQREPANMLF